MKTFKAFMIVASLVTTSYLSVGCQTSHTEKDKDTMLGGHKHEETTTTKNPITAM